jgi:hypothetical protein
MRNKKSPHGRRRGGCEGIYSAEATATINFGSMERFGMEYIHEEVKGNHAIHMRTNAAHRKAKMRQGYNERRIVMWGRGTRMIDG